MAFKYKQGYYTPKNPQKYVADVTKIRYMSSWELEVHKFFDNNPRIIKWGSECIAIPYVKPTDGKLHKYYPDYFVEYITKDGEIKKSLVEVKPLQQTRQSRSRNPRTKLYENITYAINMAKWQAAQNWCDQHSIEFKIITEGSIFK